jgi:nucleoside-diphosphate-sugar epimerase
MKILVTGGTGYLGTHVRRYFEADDLSRRSGLDVLNLQDVSVVKEYDVIVHLAAHLDKSPKASGQVFLTNVEGTVNILREVREDAVFIFASTKDVYGRFADNHPQVGESCPTLYSGQSPLEWSKLIAERYVEYYAHERSFRSCIFRLSTIYAPPTEGNVPNFIGHYADAINKGEPIKLPGGGRSRRDLLYVDDLARACEAFSSSIIRHGLYNLGGGQRNAMTLREMVTVMEDVSGLQAVVDDKHPLPQPVPLDYVSDLSLVTQELDWTPTVGIKDGLAKLFQPNLP